MVYTSKHGNRIRSHYKGPDGKWRKPTTDENDKPFETEDEALQWGHAQEYAIKRGTWNDPIRHKITFGEWVALWLPAQDLELSTLANYKYLIESHLHVWATRELESIAPEEMDPWERSIVAAGYGRRTARDARSMLITVLEDAVPRHIPSNPARRRRGKGRKGVRRIEAYERSVKVWPTPLQSLQLAERVAILSGEERDFVKLVTAAYTGARWGELLAIRPAYVGDGILDIQWKIYELNGRFYWGRPKDGSIRQVHLPPFLATLLDDWTTRARPCTCRGEEPPWCTGESVLFAGRDGGHHRRSDYSRRFLRPAADGFYPAARGKAPRPVLVDPASIWPGIPTLPRGQGQRRPTALGVNSRSTKAALAEFAVAQGMEPIAAAAMTREQLLDRYVRVSYTPADTMLVPWEPLLPGVTPHGLRHGHQTAMDNGNIKKALKVDRMGHLDPSMSGVYGHITDAMVTELLDLFQGLWEASLRDRFALHPYSPVPLLDAYLAPMRGQESPRGEVVVLRHA